MVERVVRNRLHPVGTHARKVVVRVDASTHRQQTFTELAQIERRRTTGGDCAQCAPDTLAAGEGAGVRGLCGKRREVRDVFLVHHCE